MVGGSDSMQILLLSHHLSDQTTMKTSVCVSRCLVNRVAEAVVVVAVVAGRTW